MRAHADDSTDAGRGRRAGVTVGELLREPVLQTVRVVAGAPGVDRVVTGINVMTTKAIEPWIAEGDFLISTGFPVAEYGDTAELIERLAERGVPGIGIKFDSFLPGLDPAAARVADEHGFPVVAIPVDLPLGDILQDIIGRLVALRAEAHGSAEAVDGLAAAMIADDGWGELAAGAVAAIERCSVGIYGEEGELIASAETPTANGEQSSRSGTYSIELDVSAGRRRFGSLRLVRVGTPFTSADRSAASRVALVAAAVFAREAAVDAVRQEFAGAVMHEVLIAGSVEHAKARAAAFGWDIDRPLVVAVARPDLAERSDGRSASSSEIAGRARSAWRTAVGGADRAAVSAVMGAELVAVLDADSASVERIARVQRELTATSRHTFAIGVSGVHEGIMGVRHAYREAWAAARLGFRRSGEGSLTLFPEMGLLGMMATVDGHLLRAFVDKTLGPVLTLHPIESGKLIETLDVLLAQQLNATTTARILHYHYNTVRQRLARLQDLLGPFTRDAEVRRDIQIAVDLLQAGLVRRVDGDAD